MKNNRIYDEKILDCCKIDPEIYLDHIYQDGQVVVCPHHIENKDEIIDLTADLIQSCFGKSNTPIRTIQCSARTKRLAGTMNILYKTLEQFKTNRASPKYLGALRHMLSRNYKFAAFTRYYVRQHLNDYPELAAFIS